MGLGLVALGVGFLKITLDEGREKNGWESADPHDGDHCRGVDRRLRLLGMEPREPVDLRLLQNRNFGTAVFLQLVLGMVLFASTVLIPQYLQVLLGYTADQAGMALSPGALVMMVMMAFAGRAVGKMDPRLMVCLAYLATAVGIYNLTRLDLTTSFGNIEVRRMLQVMALRVVVHPHQHAELCGRAGVEVEPDLKPVQLRAQYRRQRGHRFC